MRSFRYLENVTTLRFAPHACIGCGACEAVCPHRVFKIEDRKARLVDKDACMECGACALNCPGKAIAVHPGVGCAAYIIQTWLPWKKGAGKAACC